MMDNLSAIIVTVVSGVLVYIIGEMLQTIWLAPLQKYKEIKHDVAVALSSYAREYTNVIDFACANDKQLEEYREVCDTLRKLSCEIKGFIETLSWFKVGIPSKKKLAEASDSLMILSNSLFSPYNTPPTVQDGHENKETANEVYKALGMYAVRKTKRR